MDHKGIKILIHASTWFAPIIVPIITYIVISDREIKSLSLQALVFHIVMGVLISMSAFLSMFLIGIPFLVIFGLMAIVAPIVGIVRAANGRSFRYPMIGVWFP